MFFHANTIKNGQKMSNYDVHAKHHFVMPNHFKKGQIPNLALKMPTWQPCSTHAYSTLINRLKAWCGGVP